MGYYFNLYNATRKHQFTIDWKNMLPPPEFVKYFAKTIGWDLSADIIISECDGEWHLFEEGDWVNKGNKDIPYPESELQNEHTEFRDGRGFLTIWNQDLFDMKEFGSNAGENLLKCLDKCI
jgi:hypothetical protein